MRLIITLIMSVSAFLLSFLAEASGQWRVHSTFNLEEGRVIDTPDATYFLVHAQPYFPRSPEFGEKKIFLYRYDKEGDELQNLSSQNMLRENIIHAARYNADKRYLLVVYDNYDIDLIFDNGKIRNIAGLKSASINGSKHINDISFYPAGNRVYLAGDFGYMEIDDEKGEVVTSRQYSSPLNSVGRLGDTVYYATSEATYCSGIASGNFNLESMTVVAGLEGVTTLLSLSADKLLCLKGNGSASDVLILSGGGADPERTVLATADILSSESGREGIYLQTPDKWLHVTSSGLSSTNIDGDDRNMTGGTWDGKEFWYIKPLEGFYSKRTGGNAGEWSLTHDIIRPNAAAPFIALSIAYHPDYGFLLANRGYNRNFPSTYNETRIPIMISGLKNGAWTNYGPTFHNPTNPPVFTSPSGLAIDPDNNDYIYFGSLLRGLIKVDLSDNTAPLHMAHGNDPARKQDNFVEVVHTNPGWTDICSFGVPRFDTYGNMWTNYYDFDANEEGKEVEIWCWKADDRKASKNPASFKPFVKWKMNNTENSTYAFVYPMTSSGSRNLLLYVPAIYEGPMYIIDHNGTLETSSDDKIVKISSYIDQDGNTVEPQFIYSVYEDTATGLLWFGTTTGVFTLNPRRAMEGDTRVNRIKISRNDGTDLADYLLAQVQVNFVYGAADRKWFGTAGGGLICTTSDGRTILDQYSTDNSDIPGDHVHSICYNPQSNSILVSTDNGLGELFLSSAGISDDMSTARAYPNPVRPDYHGYVTIDGLVDNALVKIVDNGGNLVRELGPAAGGELQWDLTNLRHEHVKTGVYYVLASMGPEEGQNFSKVTKVLVVR